MTKLLGIVVALTQIGGYFAYYKSLEKNVRPNTTSWTIWTIGAILELVSYVFLTQDFIKILLPIVCSISCLVLYVYILSKGKFHKLSKTDIFILTADFAALGLWYLTSSALIGNIALQISTIISFIPIYREVYDEDENETQLPWIIWSIAYFLDVGLVFARWEKWGDLVYPLTNGILHFLMWILVFVHFKNNLKKNNMNYKIEPHLYAGKSDIAGKGLFTSKKINKGEQAFIVKGPIVNFAPKNKEEAITLPNIIGLKKDTYIDPVYPYVFLNHQCNPNLATDEDGLSFVALRDISIGEELTFDYSISEHSDWEMNCSCNAKDCRKIIKSIEKLPKNFYQRYFPYIPMYFQKVYIEKYISENN